MDCTAWSDVINFNFETYYRGDHGDTYDQRIAMANVFDITFGVILSCKIYS